MKQKNKPRSEKMVGLNFKVPLRDAIPLDCNYFEILEILAKEAADSEEKQISALLAKCAREVRKLEK